MHPLDIFALVAICLYATGYWIAGTITLVLALVGWYGSI